MALFVPELPDRMSLMLYVEVEAVVADTTAEDVALIASTSLPGGNERIPPAP
jgi:hypothetical protein